MQEEPSINHKPFQIISIGTCRTQSIIQDMMSNKPCQNKKEAIIDLVLIAYKATRKTKLYKSTRHQGQ